MTNLVEVNFIIMFPEKKKTTQKNDRIKIEFHHSDRANITFTK